MASADEKKNAFQAERQTLKTYSHLAHNKRIPTEYELISTDMLYYVQKGGFSVKTPIAAWYEQYQRKTQVRGTRFDRFYDPAQMTYALYNQQRHDQEIVLDADAHYIDETQYDRQLSAEWLAILEKMIPPLRYVWHGFQMVSSYLGSMAPEGKLVIVFAFQTMDEMRRIQRIAYRMRQLQSTYPAFGEKSGEEWVHASHWQPLRRAVEHLFVTYDWIESFVALNICFKFVFDQLFLIHFAKIAQQQGDPQLSLWLRSFWSNASWQQDWSLQLLSLMVQEDATNSDIIEQYIARWAAEIVPAVHALQPFFGEQCDPICETIFTEFVTQLKNIHVEANISW